MLLPEIDDYAPAPVPEGSDDGARSPAGPGHRLGHRRARPRRRAAHLPPRAQHDAAVGGLVLVPPALPRPHQRRRAGRPRRSTRYWMGDATASTSTSAASSTPCCTCSTPASGRRCCSTSATSTSVEPYHRLYNQGYIQAFAFTDERGVYVDAEKVDERDGRFFLGDVEVDARVREDGQEPAQQRDARRDVPAVRRRHAAGLRDVHGPARPGPARGTPSPSPAATACCSASGAPSIDEDTGDAAGHRRPSRPPRRSPRCTAPSTASAPTWPACATTPRSPRSPSSTTTSPRPTPTAASPRSVAEPLLLLLAPLAPHIAEELWSRLGHEASLAFEPFPVADPALLVQDTDDDGPPGQRQGPRQGRGRRRHHRGRRPSRWRSASEKVQGFLDGAEPRKVIARPPKLVNVVVS